MCAIAIFQFVFFAVPITYIFPLRRNPLDAGTKPTNYTRS